MGSKRQPIPLAAQPSATIPRSSPAGAVLAWGHSAAAAANHGGALVGIVGRAPCAGGRCGELVVGGPVAQATGSDLLHMPCVHCGQVLPRQIHTDRKPTVSPPPSPAAHVLTGVLLLLGGALARTARAVLARGDRSAAAAHHALVLELLLARCVAAVVLALVGAAGAEGLAQREHASGAREGAGRHAMQGQVPWMAPGCLAFSLQRYGLLRVQRLA